jgi:hypothetical protein
MPGISLPLFPEELREVYMERAEVRVRGQLGRDWSSWLGGLSIENTKDGDTIISGPVRDDSSLYGLLERLSSIGVRLVEVTVRPLTGEEGRDM